MYTADSKQKEQLLLKEQHGAILYVITPVPDVWKHKASHSGTLPTGRYTTILHFKRAFELQIQTQTYIYTYTM
jgi:hypothetical protein